MCASTLYWSNIGRIIYAASNDQLEILTGKGNDENFTMRWHCRDVLADSQKDIEISGPLEGLDKIVMEEAEVFWAPTRKARGLKRGDEA